MGGLPSHAQVNLGRLRHDGSALHKDLVNDTGSRGEVVGRERTLRSHTRIDGRVGTSEASRRPKKKLKSHGACRRERGQRNGREEWLAEGQAPRSRPLVATRSTSEADSSTTEGRRNT